MVGRRIVGFAALVMALCTTMFTFAANEAKAQLPAAVSPQKLLHIIRHNTTNGTLAGGWAFDSTKIAPPPLGPLATGGTPDTTQTFSTADWDWSAMGSAGSTSFGICRVWVVSTNQTTTAGDSVYVTFESGVNEGTSSVFIGKDPTTTAMCILGTAGANMTSGTPIILCNAQAGDGNGWIASVGRFIVRTKASTKSPSLRVYMTYLQRAAAR